MAKKKSAFDKVVNKLSNNLDKVINIYDKILDEETGKKKKKSGKSKKNKSQTNEQDNFADDNTEIKTYDYKYNYKKNMDEEISKKELEEKIIPKNKQEIENLNNNEDENNIEEIINFLVTAKMNIKKKNIDNEECNTCFLKAQEVYEHAMENITDEKSLKKIKIKYQEVRKAKKLKNFGLMLFLYFYIVFGFTLFFSFKGLVLSGIGIGLLLCTIITFLYFNNDFSNIKESVKNLDFNDLDFNTFLKIFIYLFFVVISMFFIIGGFGLYYTEKSKNDEAYNDYYNQNVTKYNVTISIDSLKDYY